MSLLLAALDQFVTSDPTPVLEAVQSQAYMAKLLEVQHSRGATGGQIFYKLITQDDAQTKEVGEYKKITAFVF